MTTNLFFKHALLPGGWAQDVCLGIADGLIATVTAGETAAGQHAIALPGIPNLHSHTFQRGFAGLTEYQAAGEDNFWSWREQMYRFALQMTPDDVEATARLAFIEMLESGFTSVAEFHYLHHAPDGTPYDNIAELASRIAAAAAETGIDLLLLPVFYAHANFGGMDPEPGQRRFITSLDQFAELYDACRNLALTGIAPHSLRAVTAEELAALHKLAGTAPFHMHIAEQTREVADCAAWCGTTPVAWLLDHAQVDAHWCLIHATQTTPAERAGIAASGAVVGLCPITEANLGDGMFHTRNFPGGFGIGTDSNVLIGAAGELRQLEYSQRLLYRERNVCAAGGATGAALWHAAARGGAQALGQLLPGLQPGAPANIVTLAATPSENPDVALNTAIFAAHPPVVDNVWVRGRQLVTAGRHPLSESARCGVRQMQAKLA